MEKLYFLLKRTFYIICLFSLIMSCSVKKTDSRIEEKDIVIENDYIRYRISSDGKNLLFLNKSDNIDLLNTDTVSYCAYIVQNGKQYNVQSVLLKDSSLYLSFGNSGVVIMVRIQETGHNIKMKVEDIEGSIQSLTFLNIPLKTTGMPYEPFASCVLSMNSFTHVRQLPALQTHLWATCYQKFGIIGAEITLLGVPMKDILSEIRSVMKNAKDIPYSDKGGAWAQLSEEGKGSYLFNFGNLTEGTVNEWIDKCSSVGFKQIDSHGGAADFFKFGSFELNSEKWPEGWDHFKRINERLHDVGISSIFHTYAFFIDKKSKYTTPVPHKDLAYFRSFTLAEPINSEDSSIIVKESTENITAITGFFVQNSRTLRVGDELIEFTGVTNNYPFKFTGCKRGLNGTKASAHKTETKAYHLKEMFGLFVPDPESELFLEIARNHAKIVNENNFDGIYLDAIDGSSILAGPEYSWYYSSKFVTEISKHLKRPVGMEMSAMEHHYWHYRSRWQAWDTPRRGIKKFIDLHTASINGGLLLPLQLGWWLNFTWEPPQTEATFVDDVEYLCCKMIGYNAGLALLGGVDQKEVEDKPAFKRFNSIIKQYEELRIQNYFNDSIRAFLRQPEKEYTLFQEDNGKYNFKPATYIKHKVAGLGHTSAKWTVKNEFQSQPVKFRIESLLSVKPYQDTTNIILTDYSRQDNFINKATSKGVVGDINCCSENLLNDENAVSFTAQSDGTSTQIGSWIVLEKKYDPWLDLSNNKALGVWIKGDGNGELLNLRVQGPFQFSHGAKGDHFVKIDFIGWKYFELVEVESAEFSKYIWPEMHVYNSYLNAVDFSKVDKLQLWYNNLSKGKQINCLIGPIKAISTVSSTIENPVITINGEKIILPVVMESGMYIEFNSPSDCKLYGSKGELIQEILIKGSVPILNTGDNNISFSCSNSTSGINPRVQVTVISEGKPL